METTSPPFRAWRRNEWPRRRDYLVTKATEINAGIELENIPPKCQQKPTKLLAAGIIKYFAPFLTFLSWQTAWSFSSQFSELACHNKDKVRSKWIILSVAFSFFTTGFLQDKPTEIAWAKKRAAEIFSILIQDLLVFSLLHSVLQFCKYGHTRRW